MKPSSHNGLDSVAVSFDAEGVVADAGLLLPATLGEHLGLAKLLARHVRLGDAPGAPNPDYKAQTLIASLIAGGDCIQDVDALRAGRAAAVLGHPVAAPSTVGIFVRSFGVGHPRQMDAVAEDLGQRAWDAGARPAEEVLTLDVDSSVVETFGLQKQGGSDFTYLKTRGYHPLFAVVAGQRDVLHARLRQGKANSGRGAASFVRQSLCRLRRWRRSRQPVVVRADSGFYTGKVVGACEEHGAQFSISIRMQRAHHDLVAQIPEEHWVDIPYWREGTAQVAEVSYRPFGGRREYRLIVRRVEPTPGSQLALRGLNYSYFAFITDREGEMLKLEADHRQHADVENVIRDLKYGLGLNHLPSGKFAANAAWLALNLIAHNLCCWLTRLAGLGIQCLKTLRRRLFNVPGRLVRSARRTRLKLLAEWPWRDQFMAALTALRTVSPPLTT